jgi:hypothetical protein
MTTKVEATFFALSSILRCACVAKLEIQTVRNPDLLGSWFGAGVGRLNEGLPLYNAKPMFPLLQIRTSELSHVPKGLQGVELMVLFINSDEYPFDKPHGDGWLIREYSNLDGLEALPLLDVPTVPVPCPITWTAVSNDAPGWEDAWELLDLTVINNDSQLSAKFFKDFTNHAGTKIGGYPTEIQHGVGLKDYVFQVGSEPRSRWMWADNGTAYFFKNPLGIWSWSCQFY